MKLKKILIGLVVFLILMTALVFAMKSQSAIVEVERTFDAPIAKVWQRWTDTESIKKWWSPKHFTAPVIQNDFRQDGTFLFSMKSPDGKISFNTGKYLEIIPQKKIVYSMSFSDEAGRIVPASHYGIPGDWPAEVAVRVEFTEVAGKTHVQVREVGIPMIMYIFAKMGWQQQFDKFEAVLKD